MMIGAQSKKKGFTYIGVLFLVLILGINLSLAGVLYQFVQKREKEKQLIFIGQQFKLAIARYYENTPGTIKQYPLKIEHLLLDNRFVNTQRYLRKVYVDPITQNSNWGVVRAPNGGVMGVYSLSSESVLKFANFNFGSKELEGKQYYKDWQFIYSPSNISVR